mmetsp:Transcript_61355/g.146112  ORF Transcript_61355/g.146112 Transcript_61355/m.146112 type:complete len:102 (-) Transcript_61355:337-642(-)
MQFRNTLARTRASRAARGSSRTTTLARAYAHLARLTRCFWPPERFSPRSPIQVWSPFGSIARSSSIAHAATTSANHSGSKGRPRSTFSRSVPGKIHGACGA